MTDLSSSSRLLPDAILAADEGAAWRLEKAAASPASVPPSMLLYDCRDRRWGAALQLSTIRCTSHLGSPSCAQDHTPVQVTGAHYRQHIHQATVLEALTPATLGLPQDKPFSCSFAGKGRGRATRQCQREEGLAWPLRAYCSPISTCVSFKGLIQFSQTHRTHAGEEGFHSKAC